MSNLTPTQTRYLALAWQCFIDEPKVDYAKFAQLANLSSAASGREMLRVTKKKLFEATADVDGVGPSTPVKGSKGAKATVKGSAAKGSAGKGGRGKKRKAESHEDKKDEGTDEGTEEEVVVGKGKGKGRGKKARVEEKKVKVEEVEDAEVEGDEYEEDEETVV